MAFDFSPFGCYIMDHRNVVFAVSVRGGTIHVRMWYLLGFPAIIQNAASAIAVVSRISTW